MLRAGPSDPSGVVLRRGTGLPVYLQVVDQLRYLIGAGRFRVGEYLPPMRQIAEELGLNLNTVLRAYGELQRDGLIQSTRGKGAMVVQSVPNVALQSRGAATVDVPESIDAMIAAAVEHALSAGLDAADVLARTQNALDSVGVRAPSGPAVAVLAAPAWRARVFAEALRAIGVRRVRPIADATSISAHELVVRPVYGATKPGSSLVGAPTLDVAVLLDRACIQELLELDQRLAVAVVAGDESAATWLADAVSGYAGSTRIQRVVAGSTADVDFADAAVVVIECGMPGLKGILGRVIQAGAAFPASLSESIEARLPAGAAHPGSS